MMPNAYNSNGNLVHISNIDDLNRNEKYYCMLCGSEVRPRSINENNKIIPHFYHIDKSKCTGESVVHNLTKHFLFKKNKSFLLNNNGKINEYVCKEKYIEKPYVTPYGDYIPDISIVTDKDEIIFVEINYSNKKDVEDYSQKWTYLNNVVVEFDVKQVYHSDITTDNPLFDVVFSEGEYLGTYVERKNSDAYCNKVRQYIIDEKFKNESQERIAELEKLDWFWNDVCKYKQNKIDKNKLLNSFSALSLQEMNFCFEFVNKVSCCKLLKEDFRNINNDEFKKSLLEVSNIVSATYEDVGVRLIHTTPRKYEVEIYPLIDDVDVPLYYKYDQKVYAIKTTNNILDYREIENVKRKVIEILSEKHNNNTNVFEYIFKKIEDHKKYLFERFELMLPYEDKLKEMLETCDNECIEKYRKEIAISYENVKNKLEPHNLYEIIESNEYHICSFMKIIGEKNKLYQPLNGYIRYKSAKLDIELEKLFSEIDVASWYTYKIKDLCLMLKSLEEGYFPYTNNISLDENVDDIVEKVREYIYRNYKYDIRRYVKDNCEYVYKEFFNGCNIVISIPNKINYNKVYLDRYDFVSATRELKELRNKIQNYINECIKNINIEDFRNYKDIDSINNLIKYSNSDYDCQLYKLLYPIICKAERYKNEDICIQLNKEFTRENGRTQRWLINDFITELYMLNIKNVQNKMEE